MLSRALCERFLRFDFQQESHRTELRSFKWNQAANSSQSKGLALKIRELKGPDRSRTLARALLSALLQRFGSTNAHANSLTLASRGDACWCLRLEAALRSQPSFTATRAEPHTSGV